MTNDPEITEETDQAPEETEPPPAAADSAEKETFSGQKEEQVDLPENKRQETEVPASGSQFPVIFDNFEIHNSRLPHLDTGPVKAYEATGKGKFSGNYFALICEFHLVPRINAIQVYSNLTNPNMVRFVHSGIVNWIPGKEQRYVFIYERTLGEPLIAKGNKQALGLKPDIIMGTVIRQLVPVLRDFRDKDFVHGNIRADNIFASGSSMFEKIVLGECLSTPPSYAQSCVYEPVERAMADPIARGLGSRADDMYAFGATLAVLLRHYDPFEGMSDREIIKQKIELGSFAAITGKDRLTGSILELLRGLLYDDPVQRWTFDELEDWMDGQRLSPKQFAKKIKAARPIVFNNKKYIRPDILAMELQDNVPEAVHLLEDGTLEQWLERSLEIKDVDEILSRAIKAVEDGGRGAFYNEKIASRLSIILDRDAPLRICGLNMRPEGVGYSLTESIIFKRHLQPYAEIMIDQSVLFWLEFQKNTRLDTGTLISRFESCRAFVRQQNSGYGIERCVYILNPECQCLSEKLEGYYVRTPEDLLLAFEDMCKNGNVPGTFMDRHIVAFLSVKDRNMVDQYLIEINSNEKHLRIMADLRVLATIQSRSRMENFPAVTKALADMLEPVYERYHDRDLRESLKKKVDSIRDSGEIGKLRKLIDNPELPKKDFRNFRAAMIRYGKLKKEKKTIEKRIETEGDVGKSTGRQVAAMVSGLIAGIVILVFTIIEFSG